MLAMRHAKVFSVPYFSRRLSQQFAQNKNRGLLSCAVPVLASVASLVACQIDSAEFDSEQVGSISQSTIGGTSAQGQAHYEAVAAITILKPPTSSGGARQDEIHCTGVLIEDRTVMTAAGCLSANLQAELDQDFTDEFLDGASVFVQFGASVGGSTKYELDATFDAAPLSVKGLTMHRYYDSKLKGKNDIALLRLSASPGITPVPIHSAALPQSLVGLSMELVGYGKKDGGSEPLDTFTGRNVITTAIVTVAPDRITAGTPEVTTCYADGGGPGFIDFGDGPEIVSITVTQADCNARVNRQRVDIHAEHFLLPFVKYVSGQCDGGGCNACDYNGVCEENCATRDWDCPIGIFAGKSCSSDGQCEEGGSCVAASDDETFTYCDKPCIVSDPGACPAGMLCDEASTRCIFDGVSPGSQGAVCSVPDDCRSGFCENSLCAFPCDASDSAACSAESGVFCLPSASDPSIAVCRTELRTGGGGFCSTGLSRKSSPGERNSLLAALGLLLLAGVFRRRQSID